MQFIAGLLAVGLVEKIRSWSAAQSGAFQALVFFGVAALIALAAFGWAIIFRQQPLRRHHRSHSKPAPADAGDSAQAGGIFSRRRHKHRRKAHRPVNPTLAETGGLPAPRDGKAPPPPPA
jgi:hypothetical protein